MNTEILFAFRTIKKIIDIPAQQKLQSEYLDKSYRSWLMKRINNSAFFRFLYCLEIFRVFLFTTMKMLVEGKDSDLVYFFSTQNQARQIRFVQSIIPDRDFVSFDFRNEKSFGFEFFRYVGALYFSFFVTLKYAKRSNKRMDAIVLANNILFLCHYIFFINVFKKTRPKAILVANDHSPAPVGFACAARSLSVRTIYIQHAYITYDLPPLRFDLALLDGQCAVDTYAEQGASNTAIFFRGLEGKERPMNTEKIQGEGLLTVGLFLNVFHEEKLMETLRALENQERIEFIIVRTHPAYPVNLSFSAFTKVKLSPRDKTLWQDAEECDVVIGGNSSFHLSVLKYGVPTLYYSDLDYVNYDDYSFLKHNICCEITSPDNLDFSKAADFYMDPDWRNRFRYFDASYGLDQERINIEMKSAILNLI